MRTALAVALVFLLVPLGGCFGGESRTQWAFEVTQLDDVADSGRTGKGVVVAVLDTGINKDHVALTHLFDGDRQNGEVIAFKDFMTGAEGVDRAYDDDGHGSHVAGIIAASGSSLGDKLIYGGVDLLGGAPGVLMVVAKVCGKDTCKSDAIPSAVNWAVANHAQVISMSFGGQRPGLSIVRDDLQRSIQNAINQGVVAIAAAGNDGTQAGDVAEPADIPDVIAVGAIQKDGSVWSDSSRGNDAAHPCNPSFEIVGQQGRCNPDKKPELVAPGVDILSAWTGDQYGKATGTSQATPFVTATVALMLEGRPPLRSASDVQALKQVLEDTAQAVPGQRLPHDDAAGYGLLQARAALEAYR